MPKINLAEKLGKFSDHWQPRIVAGYNGNDVRVVKVAGEFIWHQHNETDELFFVLGGRLDMHFRNHVEQLFPGEMIVVPKGVEHKPVAPEGECQLMLIDREGTLNTGDQDNERSVHKLERI